VVDQPIGEEKNTCPGRRTGRGFLIRVSLTSTSVQEAAQTIVSDFGPLLAMQKLIALAHDQLAGTMT